MNILDLTVCAYGGKEILTQYNYHIADEKLTTNTCTETKRRKKTKKDKTTTPFLQ